MDVQLLYVYEYVGEDIIPSILHAVVPILRPFSLPSFLQDQA